MFIDYECIDCMGFDVGTKSFRYHFRIIDTDFVEIVETNKGGITTAVIDLYVKKGLPIASNLFFLMCRIQEKEKQWDIGSQIVWNKKHNPRWKEIEADMQMYLALS